MTYLLTIWYSTGPRYYYLPLESAVNYGKVAFMYGKDFTIEEAIK